MLSITMTVPKGGGSRDLNRVAPAPEPAPQLPPDEEKVAILNRLGAMPLADLMSVEKWAMLNELGKLDPEVLKQLVDTKRK
jgi:DHA2 family multidrug resistance protein-like MFS transporter